MDLELNGRAVLVTGGASGIGQACAQLLTREGANVAVLDVALGADWRADVTDEAQVRSAVDGASSAMGGLDAVVCCAGISGPVGTMAADISVEDWDAIFAVNVKGPFLICKHAAPHLAVAEYPSIVLMCSDSAFVATPGMTPYCASKGAVLMLTKSLAADFRVQGIRVNCVCPSIVDTPMSRYDLGQPDGFAAAEFPVQSADEVARQIAFLASPVSAPMNGTYMLSDYGASGRSQFPV
jgi:NAD(P)-dependent dehydrogenase (short-subunit alcohol dehydrogenase family)